MTISYIMNTIDRFDITPKLTVRNIQKAGRPVNQIIITDNGSRDQRVKRWAGGYAHKYIQNTKNVGNPQALNNALSLATGDIIVIAGNDIELSPNWLTEAIKVLQDDRVALVGFGKVDGVKGVINGVDVVKHEAGTTGTWVFKKSLIKKLGYFATFSKYGYWDGDFCNRIRKAGLMDRYITRISTNHVCNDADSGSDYRKMKNKERKKAWPHIKELASRYSEKAHYLTRDNKLLNTEGKLTRKRKT